MKLTLKFTALILCLVMAFGFSGCALMDALNEDNDLNLTTGDQNSETNAGVTDPSVFQEPWEGSSEVFAEMSVKDFGIIKLQLDPEVAPITVNNFVNLVKEGFYDGLTFHRVYKGFMIQGGDPNGDGSGGSGKNIKGEFAMNGVNNPISHERGVISMARSTPYNSASSQFFIVHGDSDSLDGQYAAFGKVIEGMDVVDKIANVEVKMNAYGSEQTVPVNTVTIEYIKLIEE